MNNGNEYLRMILRNYEEQCAAEKKELEAMPEGSLIFNKEKGQTGYMQLIPASDRTDGKRIR